MTNYIHQHHTWPHFTWDTGAVNAVLADVRLKQGLLLGKMQSLGFDLKNEATLESLTREVITTNAIEGNTLSMLEVRSSLARRLGITTSGDVTVGRAVEGIAEVMLDATRQYDAPITKERLCGWHAALFPTGYSGMHAITVGEWRTDEQGPMQVVSGPIGREKVHFVAPAAQDVDAEVANCLKWCESDDTYDALVRAGIMHLWFVTIHPFEDGNGRITRAITELLLARADKSEHRFYSMSEQVEKHKAAYYMQLETAQKGDLDITEWLVWFLQMLSAALDGSESLLQSVLQKDIFWKQMNAHTVNERQKKILNMLLDDFTGKLTTSKHAKITKCSQDTALRDIKELMAIGVLQQDEAGGRSTAYELIVDTAFADADVVNAANQLGEVVNAKT